MRMLACRSGIETRELVGEGTALRLGDCSRGSVCEDILLRGDASLPLGDDTCDLVDAGPPDEGFEGCEPQGWEKRKKLGEAPLYRVSDVMMAVG